eukprot:596245-Amphidinium_carterae.1
MLFIEPQMHVFASTFALQSTRGCTELWVLMKIPKLCQRLLRCSLGCSLAVQRMLWCPLSIVKPNGSEELFENFRHTEGKELLRLLGDRGGHLSMSSCPTEIPSLPFSVAPGQSGLIMFFYTSIVRKDIKLNANAGSLAHWYLVQDLTAIAKRT